MKIYILAAKQTSYRQETWWETYAVVVSDKIPSMVLLKGEWQQLKIEFSDAIAALSWWIEKGKYVNIDKDCTLVSRLL